MKAIVRLAALDMNPTAIVEPLLFKTFILGKLFEMRVKPGLNANAAQPQLAAQR
jgi:hypothetical protein